MQNRILTTIHCNYERKHGKINVYQHGKLMYQVVKVNNNTWRITNLSKMPNRQMLKWYHKFSNALMRANWHKMLMPNRVNYLAHLGLRNYTLIMRLQKRAKLNIVTKHNKAVMYFKPMQLNHGQAPSWCHCVMLFDYLCR